MSVPPSEGSTSPTNLPDEPVVGILGTAVEGRGNPEGFEISDPVDVRLTEAIAQARTLATDEESVLDPEGYNFRRTGHKISFKPSDDLISFQNVVWDHLKDTGMDSIAYLRDPTDDAKMTNVIKAHARYTVQSAKLLAEAQVQRYDKYDRTNDMAARTYLLASLSTELSNKVTEKLDDSDSFPVVWLQFLKSIQSTSIERFEDLKAIIKARLPSQYSGENLEQLAAHFRKDANELTTAGQYDHNLTLAMLKIFLLAGGSGNEDFRFPLRSVKQNLEQALLDIGFKDKEAANLHMQVNKLTYKDICAHAEDAYRTLFDRKEWPPARHTRDSKAPPAAFGNMATQSPELRYSTSSSPRPPTMVLDLPRKESVTSATSLDTGRANAQRTTRARAGMGMAMKDQRMSSPEVYSSSIWSTSSQASQRKGFQLVRKLQALDHYARNGNAHWRQEEL
ncbi:hypothetical protein MHU86_5479 [Fragilaria crotonensis]|nr:hypothetical protein MHU86_5479 [Fragilaria crotonensis]